MPEPARARGIEPLTLPGALLARARARLETPSSTPLPELQRELTRELFAELSEGASVEQLRELGSAYERLLAYELGWREGELTLTRSAATRKQHGAYFSKPFVVEHLLDHALEPALDQHLARVQALPQRQRSAALFEFAVVDLSMGTGNFLLPALERIAARFRPLLRDAKQLRQRIATHCIHGVDIDPEAVALARTSLAALAFGSGDAATHLHGQLVTGDALLDAHLHFPSAFPRVFQRERPGFDVILGNPPWEEAQVEEDRFWTRHAPGLHALPQREQEARKRALRREHPELVQRLAAELELVQQRRRALLAAGYPGMGEGDVDVYKAFCWRSLALVAPDGVVGLVLPRSAFCAKGSAAWRRELLRVGQFLDLTFLTNAKRWVFDDVHPQYTIALASFRPARAAPRHRSIPVRGPFADLAGFERARSRPPCKLPLAAILEGTDTAAFPLLPTRACAAVWAQMRRSPRLDHDDGQSWRARPHRELDATNDKSIMQFQESAPASAWPVYKGESFDLWNCDTGKYYAWIDPEALREHLQAKRVNANKPEGPFAQFPARWRTDARTLPCMHPRIAFRDVSRATDSRTLRAALLPAELALTNKAPYLLWPRGDARDQAYLLGVLCSLPLDWFARRFVEVSVNYHVFNPLPIPRPGRDDPRWQQVVRCAGRLAAHDPRLRGWAKRVGVGHGPLADDERDALIAELDAAVARLYGLTQPQLVHVFESFHPTWDYGARLEATLHHFR